MSGLRQGKPAQDSARDIARHIRRMARLVRGAVLAPPQKVRQLAAQTGVQAEVEAGQTDQGRGWWVLAQGGMLNESDFAAREQAREELLSRVRRAGILVEENVWVWDLSSRAQLVLTTLPTLERARKVAARLRGKGLAIVVRREMP